MRQQFALLLRICADDISAPANARRALCQTPGFSHQKIDGSRSGGCGTK
jgi:hypothetical protein